MTPRDYLQRYWKLDVPIDANGTQWVTVKVACYRLDEDLKSKDKLLEKLWPQFEKSETIKVKVKTVSGAVEEKTFASKTEIGPFVAAPFYGKGSPEDVQIVLQLAVRYGLIGRTQQEVQRYCDEKDKDKDMGHIGLDCNGFVGNFLRHTIQGKKWSDKPGKSEDSLSSTGIRDLMAKMATPIRDMDDLVFPGTYILGRVDGAGAIINKVGANHTIAHIMISEPCTLRLPLRFPTPPASMMISKPLLLRTSWGGHKISDVSSFQIVESTGHKGLVESTYSILGVDKRNVFKVWRGSKQEEMMVRIYRVNGM